ncbi:MAG: adenosylcobinamide-GDP ribazoletransferase [Bacteroidota bacterium]|nr:adenosylcobinamide-GDP ribazoletransferase [Odoribacter sp.]MDP3643314.1 adenosylcobinamide-GDP ribazoletransferase [Bacteroidota bacterium]
MRKQLHIFLNAIMFYTRIPMPKNLPYSDEILNRSTRYFPFIGWIVGGIGASVFFGLQFVFAPELAILLSMVATIFVTGAFHEDGFADFCDGFGGGYTRERILTIMKDSHIGTYGSIGLIGMLATKFMSLHSIEVEKIPLILLAGHSLSRLMPILVIYTSEYSREDATSKTNPIGKKGKGFDFALALFFGLAFLAFVPLAYSLYVLPVLLLTTMVFRRYITNKIGGYTGDCLGALQQIAEVEFYLGFVIYQTFQVCS